MSTPETRPETRAEARRRSVASGTGRTAVIGLMLVALTFAMITLAGTSPREIGAPVGEVSRVALDQRTFVCDATLPQSKIRRGTIVDGPRPTVPASEPVITDFPREVARGAFVAEQASAKNWLAWQPCPEPHARWWFLGAGGASVTHSTVLTITNPRDGAAVVDVNAYGPDGPVDAPGLHGITVAAGATATLNLSTVAPDVGELAVSVIASKGLVAVSARDKFSPGAVGKQVREWIPATLAPTKIVTLAGLPLKPDAATLLMVNPGDVEVNAEVEVIGSGNTFKPEGLMSVTLPPNSVRAVPLGSVFDGTALAVRVTGTGPLTATIRASRKADIAFAAAVRPIRGATAVAVPSGDNRRLVFSSLGEAGTVTLTGYDAEAGRVLEKEVSVPAGASVAVKLAADVAYLRLSTESSQLVAGLAVLTEQGMATAGIAPAIRSIRLPVVHQGW